MTADGQKVTRKPRVNDTLLFDRICLQISFTPLQARKVRDQWRFSYPIDGASHLSTESLFSTSKGGAVAAKIGSVLSHT
jgi:hypothetical protein